MGKRKLHGQVYYQCDWTGFPMKNSNAYMPTWNEQGKLTKHGSYCCFEAVVAHANHMYENNEMTTHLLTKVQQYVNEITGSCVMSAPHYNELAWSNGTWGMDKYMDYVTKCCNMANTVTAVRLGVDGVISEIAATPAEQKDKFKAHLVHPPTNDAENPQSMQLVRKRAYKDHDLTVFYWPFKNGLAFNQTASNILKMQIFGDVVFVQQSKEPCCVERQRYVSYYKATFDQQFTTSRKRKEVSTLSTDEYTQASKAMTQELTAVEDRASASATAPSELARAAALPPPVASELAALLVAQGREKPSKKKARTIPPPCAQSPVAAALTEISVVA